MTAGGASSIECLQVTLCGKGTNLQLHDGHDVLPLLLQVQLWLGWGQLRSQRKTLRCRRSFFIGHNFCSHDWSWKLRLKKKERVIFSAVYFSYIIDIY